MRTADGSMTIAGSIGDRPALRPHHLDQRYLEERFKALEDRVATLERDLEADKGTLAAWARD